METRFDRDDARARRLRSVDAARAYADQLVVGWLFICRDFRPRFDCRNAVDVRIDRLTVRIQRTKTDWPSPGTANTGRRF